MMASNRFGDYEIPRDLDGNPMPAMPTTAWERANRQLVLIQSGLISAKSAMESLEISYSAPGGVIALGPGEDCEIIPPAAPPPVRWQGNCEHCGHRYMDTDRCCPFCGGQLLAPPAPENEIMGHPVVQIDPATCGVPPEYGPCPSPPRESDHMLDAFKYAIDAKTRQQILDGLKRESGMFGLLNWRV